MSNHHSFVGGNEGPWQVTSTETIVGDPLEKVKRVNMLNVPASSLAHRGVWTLQGFTSNLRYAEKHEVEKLKASQEGLGRPAATCAALIPIKKNAKWWAMPQDERRKIFEAQSRHTEIGLAYLPEIARQLHHCRDIGEPFDFVTWFEFAPEHTESFNELLARLRASKGWTFVEREIDIRLTKLSE